jgi:hypothetical protein
MSAAVCTDAFQVRRQDTDARATSQAFFSLRSLDLVVAASSRAESSCVEARAFLFLYVIGHQDWLEAALLWTQG